MINPIDQFVQKLNASGFSARYDADNKKVVLSDKDKIDKLSIGVDFDESATDGNLDDFVLWTELGHPELKVREI